MAATSTPSPAPSHSPSSPETTTRIPRARPQDGVVVKVIAGESHGVKSQIYTRTPTMFLDFKMDKDKTVTQTIPATYNGFIYVLSDTAYTRDLKSETEAKAHHTLLLSEDGTSTVRNHTKDEEAKFVMIARGTFEGICGSDWFVCNEYPGGGV
ncbi:hypothetical protein BKA57DRAFT_492304 [Linnemannia elongata]|nr:hypothetical protein BKA57DRAFT_492304 [Linnemannia elongata]